MHPADVPYPHGEIVGASGHDVPSKWVTLEPPYCLRVPAHDQHWGRQLPNVPQPHVGVHTGREEVIWIVLAPITGEEFPGLTVGEGGAMRGCGRVPQTKCPIT